MLPEFVEQFWMPLYSRLESSAQRRLVVLATTELNSIPARWTSLLRRAQTRTLGRSNEHLPVLVELENYTGDELNRWLRRWLSFREAESLSRQLMEETGGAPAVLYQKLIWDETTWARPGRTNTVAG
jgi:hypothetical protein